MTDKELNKALALAIGWTEDQILVLREQINCCVDYNGTGTTLWKQFDYRDPAVIWPIAMRYDLFPWRIHSGWISYWLDREYTADTAEKAVALAVIGERK